MIWATAWLSLLLVGAVSYTVYKLRTDYSDTILWLKCIGFGFAAVGGGTLFLYITITAVSVLFLGLKL